MNTLESLKQSTPEFFKAHADNLAALDMLKGVLLGQGYIIMINDSAVQPELAPLDTDNKFILKSGTLCPIAKAQRFDKETAEKLAAGMQNGHGHHARAVHIRDALVQAIADFEQLIKELAQI